MRERGFEDLPPRLFVFLFSFAPLCLGVLRSLGILPDSIGTGGTGFAFNIIFDLIKESEFFPEVIFKQFLIQSDPQSGKIRHIDMTLLN